MQKEALYACPNQAFGGCGSSSSSSSGSSIPDEECEEVFSLTPIIPSWVTISPMTPLQVNSAYTCSYYSQKFDTIKELPAENVLENRIVKVSFEYVHNTTRRQPTGDTSDNSSASEDESEEADDEDNVNNNDNKAMKSYHTLTAVELTYKNINTGKMKKYGLRGYSPLQPNYLREEYNLEDNEFITSAAVGLGRNYDRLINLEFTTNKKIEGGNRKFNKGMKLKSMTPIKFEFEKKQEVIVGLFGVYGYTCLNNVGFYSLPLKDVRYYKRRLFILMRETYKRKEQVREKIEKLVKWGIDNPSNLTKEKWALLAFGLVLRESNMVFKLVMSYV